MHWKMHLHDMSKYKICFVLSAWEPSPLVWKNKMLPMVIPLVWLPFVEVDPLNKNTAITIGQGSSPGHNRGKFEVKFLRTCGTHKCESSQHPLSLCAEAFAGLWIQLNLMSIFLLSLLTSNPKNLSLAGKNRNGTGKAMDLKSVSGISVWANLPWWSHERTALESKMENFWIQHPRQSQNKSLLRWLKITLQRIMMVMWKAHNLSEPE